MAAIVPTVYGSELASVPPQSQVYQPLNPNKLNGRRRHASFSYTMLGTETTATIIGLTYIPQGAMVLKSDMFSSAGFGASLTFNIGIVGRNGNGYIDDGPGTSQFTSGAQVADNATFFGTFSPANAAASGNFADTMAHNVGYITAKDVTLIASVASANASAGGTLFGYVSYVVD